MGFPPILAWLVGSGEQLAAYESVIEAFNTGEVDTAALEDGERWVIAGGTAVGLFASVTFHELGHAWVAMRYDIGGGVDHTVDSRRSVESLRDARSVEPRVLDRGRRPGCQPPARRGLSRLVTVLPTDPTVLVFLVVTNLVLAVFNMLPAFPMDGDRVLAALLGCNRSCAGATQTAARVGQAFAILFALVGLVVVFSPVLLLLALFVCVAATSESRSVVLGELLRGLTVSDVADNGPVDADDSAATVFDRLLASRRSELAAAENGRVIGVVTGSLLRKVPTGAHQTTTAGLLATTDLPRSRGARAGPVRHGPLPGLGRSTRR